jgi:cysteine desulfuration protein SufE
MAKSTKPAAHQAGRSNKERQELMRATDQAAAEIIDEFSFFDDWADKYEQLIDQGRQLPPLPDKYRVDACKLSGCQSTVWFAAEQQAGGQLRYFADSDAAIVRGLIALLLRVYSDKPPADILATEPDFLAKIGLDKHLSATRRNGLASMISAIRAAASKAQIS